MLSNGNTSVPNYSLSGYMVEDNHNLKKSNIKWEKNWNCDSIADSLSWHAGSSFGLEKNKLNPGIKHLMFDFRKEAIASLPQSTNPTWELDFDSYFWQGLSFFESCCVSLSDIARSPACILSVSIVMTET